MNDYNKELALMVDRVPDGNALIKKCPEAKIDFNSAKVYWNTEVTCSIAEQYLHHGLESFTFEEILDLAKQIEAGESERSEPHGEAHAGS